MNKKSIANRKATEEEKFVNHDIVLDSLQVDLLLNGYVKTLSILDMGRKQKYVISYNPEPID